MMVSVDWAILSILAVAISVGSFVFNQFISVASRDRKYEARFVRLETQMELYWHSVEDRLSKNLHSPHLPETDILLEKVLDGTITLAERQQLINQLLDHLCEDALAREKCVSAEVMIAIQEARLHQARLATQK